MPDLHGLVGGLAIAIGVITITASVGIWVTLLVDGLAALRRRWLA